MAGEISTPDPRFFRNAPGTFHRPARQTCLSVLTRILINIKIRAFEPYSDGASDMYVCLCTGVTDGQIREAIYEGCCSYREVRQATGVASQCGKCACLAKEVVRDTLAEVRTAQAVSSFPVEFTAA